MASRVFSQVIKRLITPAGAQRNTASTYCDHAWTANGWAQTCVCLISESAGKSDVECRNKGIAFHMFTVWICNELMPDAVAVTATLNANSTPCLPVALVAGTQQHIYRTQHACTLLLF